MEVQLKSVRYSPSLPLHTRYGELLPAEIYNLLRLSHRNVQDLHDYGYRHKTWRLMLEYSYSWEPLSGLTHTLPGAVLDADDIRAIVRQLLSVILHLFKNGVDHRGLATENIYLDRRSKQIKLFNFQLSTVMSVLPHTTPASPTTTPPELYRQGSYTPTAAAVWSVGCVLFELFTCKRPLLSQADAACNNVRWELFTPQAVGRDVFELVLSCLNPRPERRISLEELLKHSWIVNESYV